MRGTTMTRCSQLNAHGTVDDRQHRDDARAGTEERRGDKARPGPLPAREIVSSDDSVWFPYLTERLAAVGHRATVPRLPDTAAPEPVASRA
ncbi:hypothetical protein HEK616_81580 (plasmid) [Streptomyces nigrescens]|uniref:Uncharacterized protein n=2 Tax=Streptomyces TaxID=1883 RepID=A0ABN6R9P9_STRNI|nr:hypothetical protein [Streptomyces nigrescens]MEE4420613.1 hypothetical protein [Streptomyces sp. DSM 41528]BDM74671.1 hypothetical protein HEK616_81580 [Streptomyces nigrescens]